MTDGGRHGTSGTGLTGSGTHGTTGSGYGSSTPGSGLTGSHNTGTHGTTGAGYGSSTAGPHSSSMANKADPRVDSDLGKFAEWEMHCSRLTFI